MCLFVLTIVYRLYTQYDKVDFNCFIVGCLRQTAYIYTREKKQDAINNLQYKDIRNIGHTRHRTKTKRKKLRTHTEI